MKLFRTCWLVAGALLALAGCAKKKEISPLERKQAASLASDAEFAVTLRDFTKAEGLLAQAANLCPDEGRYWLNLGMTRVRLKQTEGARDAYQKALKALQEEEKTAAELEKPPLALQQVYVLALLGRADEARGLESKLMERYPKDRNIRNFVESKQLDRMLGDAQFKQIAL